MNKLLYLPVMLSIICLISSCTEDDNAVKIKAEVLEYETLDPIADAQVNIYGANSNGGFSGSTYFLIDSVQTDSDGLFTWESTNVPIADFYSVLSVQKDNYYDIDQEVLIYGNTLEGETQQIILDPFAWLHLNVVDDPSIPGDWISTNATFIPGASGIQGAFEGNYNLRGNRFIYIKTKKEIGGPLQTDTLYLPALDTLYHEIRF